LNLRNEMFLQRSKMFGGRFISFYINVLNVIESGNVDTILVVVFM
jgi:hypothetical protein